MKIIISSIILSLSFIIPNYAQPGGLGVVTIKSMRRVSKNMPSVTKNDFGVAIELVTTNPSGFYVGAAYFCLQIGELTGLIQGYYVHHTKKGKFLMMSKNQLLVIGIPEAEWENLEDGDPMFLSYGCKTVTDFDKAKPFAFLNKKLLIEQSHKGLKSESLNKRPL